MKLQSLLNDNTYWITFNEDSSKILEKFNNRGRAITFVKTDNNHKIFTGYFINGYLYDIQKNIIAFKDIDKWQFSDSLPNIEYSWEELDRNYTSFIG